MSPGMDTAFHVVVVIFFLACHKHVFLLRCRPYVFISNIIPMSIPQGSPVSAQVYERYPEGLGAALYREHFDFNAEPPWDPS